jgi:hyperosmotically inducible protein
MIDDNALSERNSKRRRTMVTKMTVKRMAAAGILVLALTGCQAMTGKTAGRNVDDAAITASVKSTLVADKAANLTRIDVDTNNGVVSLNGVVDSAQQRSRAEDLARRVEGVRGVNNNLQISSR